ncbi:MAG TPA: secretin and TonB N-terminal domain-containing protein, partial [candidate division Zixibacteria bacterium]|nr:secretin and TonB N-terminal domain-containing protein [candidate division Zixibacteria bacterium]
MKLKIICLGLILTLLSSSAAFTGVFDTQEKLSLDLESVSLPMVLNMIAKQYNLNVVLSDDVDGKVSVRLNEVDLQTALESILFPNGYNYYLDDDVIVVKPLANIALGELTSKVVTLKYLEPVTAKKALESMVSDKGTVVILDQTAVVSTAGASNKYKPNRLLITDYPQM